MCFFLWPRFATAKVVRSAQRELPVW
uniref:Uncharacterized protein n=1 Tax=Anguilla anguilla TaxID=7936 RepID=A0A0E9PAW1_ANGAN